MTTSTSTNAASTKARPRAFVVVVVAALVVGAAVPATSTPSSTVVTSARTAAIVVRALAYDRGLRDRAGARADLVVLTTPDRVVDEHAVFLHLQSIGVQGLPLVVSTAAPATADDLRAVLDTRHAEAVFVDALDPDLRGPLRTFARERGIAVFADRREALGTVAQIAVVDDGDRARIVVSLPELRAARIDLAADLLKLAEVVR